MTAAPALLPCVCYEDGSNPCVCGPLERKLHHVISYGAELTAAERAQCADEIAGVEGYSRKDADGVTDEQLAHTTLAAWTDYCRDKGLL